MVLDWGSDDEDTVEDNKKMAVKQKETQVRSRLARSPQPLARPAR